MSEGKLHEIAHALHDWMEKIKVRISSRLPRHSHLNEGWIHKIFGSTLLSRELWSFKAEALAHGLGLGLFVAFTPTIGFQMIIVCALILLFPGNLPIALAATWVTNVVTAPPIYFYEYKLGKWLIEITGAAPYEGVESMPKISGMYDVAGAMWVGSLVTSIIAGLAGYFLTLGVVNLERRLRMKKISVHRRAGQRRRKDD